VVAEEGWTKAGMDKMRKMESFLRADKSLCGTINIVPETCVSRASWMFNDFSSNRSNKDAAYTVRSKYMEVTGFSTP